MTGGGADAGGGGGEVSTMTGGSRRYGARTNSQGDSHCYNCGGTDHWAYEGPQLTSKRQAQLHMNVEGNKEVEEQEQEGHQLLNVTLAQGGLLPDNRAYLNRCLTVTAFKTNKYLQEIKTMPGGFKINCNAGAVSIN
jgi:hypothetical protein